MTSNSMKILLLLLLVASIYTFFALNLGQYLTLDYIKSQQENLNQYYHQNSFLMIVVFSFTYIAITALSLPVATILTLASGAIFGFFKALIIVSFASTIGATLSFLISRFLLKNWVQNKYGKHLSKLNEGFNNEGAFYLFAMRLAPIVPFFVINLVMALSPIKIWTFFWVSQLGMLAGTIIYVYAGTELSKISTLSDIASPTLLIAFTLLGAFPLIAKKALTLLRKKNHEQV